VDYLVVLSHQGIDGDVLLAKKVVGIDAIIGAHSQSFLQTPAVFGKTSLFQSSFRNQYVGVISLKKSMTDADYKLIGLDAGYESPAESPTDMDKLVTNFKKAIADLNTKVIQAQMVASEDPAGAQSFHTFPKCAECHMKQFDFWRKTPHMQALRTLIEKQQSKNKECLQCHTVGLGNPQGFSNINQLAEVKLPDSDEVQPLSQDELHYYVQTLSEVGSVQSSIKLRSSDKEALPIRELLNRTKKAWAPVQCENCHQPGGNHPFSSQYPKQVENKTCLNCHTAERAPSWYSSSGQPNVEEIEKKRKQITCPAGDLVDTE
jgi:mono/diheme cytochrome c family protein